MLLKTSLASILQLPLTDGNTAIDCTYSIASVGITTLKMLETLLPKAAGEVERESTELSHHFMALVRHIEAQGNVPPEIAGSISAVITGMQFQDRNTQIMENVTCMLERYRTMLEDVCTNIEAMRKGEVSPGHTITLAVEDILSSIRLSDIRVRYLEALAKANMHPATPSPDTHAKEPESSGEAELF